MILRLCGKYIHLMKALEPIASNVFISMMQLLEYYLFVVYNFFTKDLVRVFIANSHPHYDVANFGLVISLLLIN